MKALLIYSVLLFGLFTNHLSAQVGAAVVKDNNGSIIRYQLNWNCESVWRCQNAASDLLESQGYSKISYLGGGEYGCSLTSGCYVLVKSSVPKSYGGSVIAMGLGAGGTYAEAERQAVRNLNATSWGWREEHGYRVEQQGPF